MMENLSQHLSKMQEQINTLKLRCQTQQIMIKKLSREKQELLDANKLIKKDLIKIYENIMEKMSSYKSIWGNSILESTIDDMMTLIMTIETGDNKDE